MQIPNLRDVDSELARRKLAEFTRQSWHIIEPAKTLVENWHVGAITEHLEAVSRGEIRHLLINIPPGHAKSLLVSVLWPAWIWTWRPMFRSIFASYSDKLARRDSIRCRRLIESDWFRTRFTTDPITKQPWLLTADQNRQDDFANTLTGRRMATSVGGTATGERGDMVCVDDPISVLDAYSEAMRSEAVRWWDETMPSRVDDPMKAAFVIIMQRVHEGDLSGHVLAKELGYEHLCLPAEFEPRRKSITYINRNGTREKFWEDPRTHEGELLFPKLFPKEYLDEQKRKLSMGYPGQYQQRPSAAEGGIFKLNYWRFWKPDGTAPDAKYPRPLGCWDGPAVPLPKLDTVVISLDTSFKDGKHNDFGCALVIGCNGANRYVLAQRHGHWTVQQACNVLRELHATYPHTYRIYVEAKANGDAVIQLLQSEIASIVPVEPMGGKESRAAACEPQVASGNCYLPEGAPWLDDFVTEFAVFPNGLHDDRVDSLSQALNALGSTPAMTRAMAMSKM